MNKASLIRTIYLYLFSLVGLVLLVIGGVGLVNLGLKAWVFTAADFSTGAFVQPEMPTCVPMVEADVRKVGQGETAEITAEQAAALKTWLVDYERWQQQSQEIDYVKSNHHRSAANDLAMIIIGLPLFLIHWLIVRKENRGVLA